jgi:hypothetical protein
MGKTSKELLEAATQTRQWEDNYNMRELLTAKDAVKALINSTDKMTEGIAAMTREIATLRDDLYQVAHLVSANDKEPKQYDFTRGKDQKINKVIVRPLS